MLQERCTSRKRQNSGDGGRRDRLCLTEVMSYDVRNRLITMLFFLATSRRWIAAAAVTGPDHELNFPPGRTSPCVMRMIA